MKTMKKNWLICLSIIMMILLISSTCDKEETHDYITFVNQSNLKIYVSLSTVPINNPNDTLLDCYSIKNILDSNSRFHFEYGPIDTWDDYFRGRSYIQFMVFSKPIIIDDCTKEYIDDFTKKYQLKRYQLTKEDLDKMDWTITYSEGN